MLNKQLLTSVSWAGCTVHSARKWLQEHQTHSQGQDESTQMLRGEISHLDRQLSGTPVSGSVFELRSCNLP